MAKYLLHQARNGTVLGVWREGEGYYPPGSTKKSYGEAVVANRGTKATWDDFIDQLAFKTPGPANQWDVYDADGTLELSEVFEEATQNTSYGDS